MMNKYLITTVITYRVATISDVLQLREELSKNGSGELINFSYKTKYIKEKGDIVDEYQLVKATISFNSEKEPESIVDISFNWEA